MAPPTAFLPGDRLVYPPCEPAHEMGYTAACLYTTSTLRQTDSDESLPSTAKSSSEKLAGVYKITL